MQDETTVPNSWAGGSQVQVPGVGGGRVVNWHSPRVVEADLPAAGAAVFVIDRPDGPEAVVLVDPRFPHDRRLRVIEAARQLEEAAAAAALSGLPVVRALPDQPGLRLLAGGGWTGQTPIRQA